MESLQNRMKEPEERISVLEDISCHQGELNKKLEAELSQSKKKNVQELNNTIKRLNIRVMGVPEGTERETGFIDIFNEIIKKNFPNLEKELGNKVQESHRTPKLSSIKHKEKILKCACGKNQLTYKETPGNSIGQKRME